MSGFVRRAASTLVTALAVALPVAPAAAVGCNGSTPGLNCPAASGLCAGDPVSSATPVTILHLGQTSPGGWITGTLTTETDDCSGVSMPGSGIDVQAVSWADASGWTPEMFRAFDVIVVDSVSATAFQAFVGPFGRGLPLQPTDPWLPAFRAARRAIATTVHLDSGQHWNAMNAFREFSQRSVAWLARDECCELPSSLGVVPAIFVIADTSVASPFAYSPWRGLARSFIHGTDSFTTCNELVFSYDDVTFRTCHEVLCDTDDEFVAGSCNPLGNGGGNDDCSFDQADQSIHALWQAGVADLPGESCGYETHGFSSIMKAERVPVDEDVDGDGEPDCDFIDCTTTAPALPFDGVEVTLVRDLGCCPDEEPVPIDEPDGECFYPAGS